MCVAAPGVAWGVGDAVRCSCQFAFGVAAADGAVPALLLLLGVAAAVVAGAAATLLGCCPAAGADASWSRARARVLHVPPWRREGSELEQRLQQV